MNKPIHLILILFFSLVSSQPQGISRNALEDLKQKSKLLQSVDEESRKKLTQAMSLEKAGLFDEALQIYWELNTSNPGVFEFYLPLKNLLKSQKNWGKLIQLGHQFSNAKKQNIESQIELLEIYLLAEKPEKWRQLLSELSAKYFDQARIVKKIVTIVINNGFLDEAYETIKHIRLKSENKDFYSMEMGMYFTSRMSYENAIIEFLLYLEYNRNHAEIVADRVMLFPNAPEVNTKVRNHLVSSPILEANIALSYLEFREKRYREAYIALLKSKPSPNACLEFGRELSLVKQFDLAEEVFSAILDMDADRNVLESAIFEIANSFETKTINESAKLPISGMFKQNIFFQSPYIKIQEIQMESIQKAIVIYDSLLLSNQNPQAAFRLADIRFKALGDLDGASSLFADVVNAPQKKELRQNALFRLADVYIAKGNLEKAMEILKSQPQLFSDEVSKINNLMKQSQILFYQGNMVELDSSLVNLLKSSDKMHPLFNDILGLYSTVLVFKDTPEIFDKFAESQLKIMQNKRTEAIDILEEITETPSNIVNEMVQYQLSLLLMKQGKIEKSLSIVSTIQGHSIYTEMAMILNAEILDFLLNNVSKSIDIYLEFLETYPNSIYYDTIRLRLRELAS